MSLGMVLLLGLFLGMRHAFDPDHVVAVSTILSRSRSLRQAARVGVAWGLGHSLTILAAGVVMIAGGLVVPERMTLALEAFVGVMLLVLGVGNLLALRSGLESPHDDSRASGLLRPIAVGVVHGLAGSAAVTLLILATIRQPLWAVAYLVIFGAGTVAGMVAVTCGLARALDEGTRRVGGFRRRFVMVSGAASIVLGVVLAAGLLA